MTEIISLGLWIKRRRKALDLTQAELARQVGCSLELIQKIEADARRPSREIAALLATHLQLVDAERDPFIKVARAEIGAERLASPAQSVVRGAFVPASALPSVATPDQRTLKRPTNLPTQPTALIGREHEITQSCASLRTPQVRLVTLTGPGGIGKTRLGLKIAAHLLDDFSDGVYFVDLAPLRDPALVMSAIAQTLGIKETGVQPLMAQLRHVLGDTHLLLLLDNFEQVLDAAPVLAELLMAAPGVKLLVTSRERLHLRGEKEVVVPPLALPERAPLPALDQLSQYAAVALFIERASDVQADFRLTNANAVAVTRICTRLDGLPLAIELAAARSKLFAPEALLAHLSNPLTLLIGGARDLPARQQTMRHTIAWSYDLLDDAEQTLFQRLGICIGGCTLQAATAILHGTFPSLREEAEQRIPHNQAVVCSQEAERTTLEGLGALVDKSLLQQVRAPDGSVRFVMLQTIHEYALEQLEMSSQAASVQERHAHYFSALAEAAEPELVGSQQAEWLNRLEMERDNIRTALLWSYTDTARQATVHGDSGSRAITGAGVSTQAEVGWRLVGALGRFWQRRGPLSDGRIGMMVAQMQIPHLTKSQQMAQAKALITAGTMAYDMGDTSTAITCCQESLARYRALDYTPGIAEVLRNLGMVAWLTQDHAARNALLEESLMLYQQMNDQSGMARVRHELAYTAWSQGDFVRATELFEENLVFFRKRHDQAGIGMSLIGLGMITSWQGAYVRATELLEEGLAVARMLSDKSGTGTGLLLLGHVAVGVQAYTHAATLLEESLALGRELDDRMFIAWSLRSLGTVAYHQGDSARAAELHAHALTLYRECTDLWGITECLEGLAAACGQKHHHDHTTEAIQPQIEAAWLLGAAAALREKTGNPMSPVDRKGVADATAVARTTLGEAAFQAAWAAGQALTLEQAITKALNDTAEVPLI